LDDLPQKARRMTNLILTALTIYALAFIVADLRKGKR
jgi:hypothetical protein